MQSHTFEQYVAVCCSMLVQYVDCEEGRLGAGAVRSLGFRRSSGFSWAATGRLQGVAALPLVGV